MSFLLQILIGCYAVYEAITISIAIIAFIFFRQKMGNFHFWCMMSMQNGYYKMIKATINSIFKIVVSICIISIL